jgi:AraC-like DNA-binding protein
MPWNLRPDELEALPRPVAALANNYADGHVIARHRHRRAQLVYAARGVMTVKTESGAWVVPPQRAVWMPAGMEHEVHCARTLAMRSLFIEPAAAAGMGQACRVVNVTPLLRELILRAVELPGLYDEAGPEGRLVALILDEVLNLETAPLHLPLPRDPHLAALTGALLDDPADRRGLDAWAAELGLSTRTLARRFQREIGMGFAAWRQQARLLQAVARLAEGASVTTLAYDLGYDTPSAFIAMFRRSLGVTPGRYFDREASDAA